MSHIVVPQVRIVVLEVRLGSESEKNEKPLIWVETAKHEVVYLDIDPPNTLDDVMFWYLDLRDGGIYAHCLSNTLADAGRSPQSPVVCPWPFDHDDQHLKAEYEKLVYLLFDENARASELLLAGAFDEVDDETPFAGLLRFIRFTREHAHRKGG